jgi:hypothetical protein
MWEGRGNLGAIVHSHPGAGTPTPSHTDVTTFAACEAALGKRIKWGIMSKDQLAWYEWTGPQEYDYHLSGLESFDKMSDWQQELHEQSYGRREEND